MARRLSACARIAGASGADAEVVAFELNVEASRRGILPRGLPNLHFTHGRFGLWSVDDLRRALRIDTAPPPPPHTDGVRDPEALAALAAAVNRSFVNGRDAGVLAEWNTTPLCDSSLRIEGPSSAPCGALDGPCMRGRIVPSAGCCTVDLAPTGARCDEGVCSAAGACVDASEVPESERVHGALSWLEVMTEGLPHAWHDAAEGRVRVSVVPLSSPGGGSGGGGEPPSWESWESRFGGDLGAEAFAMDASVTEATGRVAFGRTDGVTSLASVGVDALGASVLYVGNEPARVCVVQGRRVDELGPVMNDCSTGGVALACPGEAEGLRCVHEDGFAVVSGDDLTLAFELEEADEEAPVPLDFDFQDVIPLDFPGVLCVSRECQRLYEGGRGFPTGGTPVSRGRCPIAPGCTGNRICFGGPGRREVCICATPPEVCDGLDDDCDGLVDEGADPSCDDGIACTIDYCTAAGTCAQRSAAENAQLCRAAFCQRGVCNGQVPQNFPGNLRADPSPQDANGCTYFFDDDFCEDSFDRCECNGRSMCDPTRAAAEGFEESVTGCTENFFWPSGWPCDWGGDQNACTPEICCEPNGSLCRHLLDAPPVGQVVRGSTTILPPDDALCQQQGATEVRAGNTGQTALCLRVDQTMSETDREHLACNDGDPCTIDVCGHEGLGICIHVPLDTFTSPDPVTVQPLVAGIPFGDPIPIDSGCTGDGSVPPPFGPGSWVNRGCARRACITDTTGTSCQLFAFRTGPFLECTGPVAGTECLHYACTEYGSCFPTPDHSLCDDGLPCTDDVCGLGQCEHPVTSGTCRIGNDCYDDRDPHPGSPTCFYCDVNSDQNGWTPVPRDPEEPNECLD